MTKIKNIWHRVVSYFNLEPKKVEPVKEPQESKEDQETPTEIDLCNLWGDQEDPATMQAVFKAFGMDADKGPHPTILEPIPSEDQHNSLQTDQNDLDDDLDDLLNDRDYQNYLGDLDDMEWSETSWAVPPEKRTQIADFDESNVSGGFKALKDFPPRDYFMGLVNRFLWEAFLYDNGERDEEGGWKEEGEAARSGDQDGGERVPKNIHHAVMEAYNKSQKFEDLDAETASWLKDNLAKVIDRLRQTGGAEGSEGFFDLAMLYHFDRDGTVKLEGLTIHKKGKTMTVTLDVPMPVTTGPMNKVLASLAETYTKEGKTREILQELGPKIKALHIEESSRKQVKGKTSGTKKPAKKPVKRKK
jgi:hypothetical protein